MMQTRWVLLVVAMLPLMAFKCGPLPGTCSVPYRDVFLYSGRMGWYLELPSDSLTFRIWFEDNSELEGVYTEGDTVPRLSGDTVGRGIPIKGGWYLKFPSYFGIDLNNEIWPDSISFYLWREGAVWDSIRATIPIRNTLYLEQPKFAPGMDSSVVCAKAICYKLSFSPADHPLCTGDGREKPIATSIRLLEPR